ncbi:MAG: glycosyltransferase family 4 protein [Chloroflexota bacterium]
MLIHRFHPHVGGAETQLKSLLPHLSARGMNVQVITRQEPGAPEREIVDGAPVFRMPIPKTRGAASLSYTRHALSHLWRHRAQIQLIHAHGLLSPSTTAVLAQLLLRVPIVVTTHGFEADLALLSNAAFGRQRFEVINRMVNRFIVISDEIGLGLQQHGVSARKLVPVRNGIDVNRFQPASAVERELQRCRLRVTDRRVVLYVGRLEPVKGADCLLDAWPAVLERVPEAELVIAGDGSCRDELEARSVPRVRFLGAQHDPLPLYQAADCYVLPSRSEGLPVALLEALAVGLPVVSTSVGGATEILRGFEHSSLVTPGDPDALASGIARQLGDSADANQRAVLRRRVEEDYSIQSTANSLASLYRSLVGLEVG